MLANPEVELRGTEFLRARRSQCASVIQQAQEAVNKWIHTYGVRNFNEVTNMAKQTGTDLEKALEKNLQKKTSRDFDRLQQNDKLRSPRSQ